MKLYHHPASTTSRPVVLFAAEAGIPLELQVVDLFSGEQYGKPFEAINFNHQVPVLEDGDFRLTESSAILKYLADAAPGAAGSPAYPKELKQRARVNESMDWINTQLNRELGYGFVYPQCLPHHKRPTDAFQQAQLAWGRERARQWLGVLDQHLLGPDKHWLCGDTLTIADYFASGHVSAAELTGNDYAGFPNVQRWLSRMKGLKAWGPVHDTFYGLATSIKGSPFVTL